MRVLLTGAAGFIGMHVAARLLQRGDEVTGIDNLNHYYDVRLKLARLRQLEAYPGFRFVPFDIKDQAPLDQAFAQARPQRVVHLAAQAGVRYSLQNPRAYADANLTGFVNVLEACRNAQTEHLVYASSSSVYGGNTALPYHEQQSIDHPISLYAATKKANELMAHSYSHLFGLPTTGLRFFTVYGPWGRPDMAAFLFTRAMLEQRPIDIFNHGQMLRDFTYIDDVVEAVVRVLDKPATPDPDFDPLQPEPATSRAPYRVFNVGAAQPIPLIDFVGALEAAWGIEACKNFLPLQSGDVPATSADTAALLRWTGYQPQTSLGTGVQQFVDWYRSHYLHLPIAPSTTPHPSVPA